VKIKWEEIWPIVNILNEICHGIDVDLDKMGFKYEEILNLLNKLKKYDPGKSNYDFQITIELNASELKMLIKSFKEVFRQIEEWEFQTRIGITIQEAKSILSNITVGD